MSFIQERQTNRSVCGDLMTLKERIIDESLKLFSRKSFLNTSVQDIMEAAETSKGGFYNHFKTKEDLFFQVMEEARVIWRERNLQGLSEIEKPIEKLKKLLSNYEKRYLRDSEAFPGGCIFINMAVELGDQRPHLSKDLQKGFVGVKEMIERHLDEAREAGDIGPAVDTPAATEIVFSGMLGASLVYRTNSSAEELHRTISALIQYLDSLKA
jgi:TetR/AcrR family transcriptional repressor of nem operon